LAGDGKIVNLFFTVYAKLTQVFADGQDTLAALNFEGFHVLSSPGNLLKK
jgi:hypothetical protein